MWELVFGALAVLYVSLDIVFDQVSGATDQVITMVEIGLTGLFVAEFALRLWAAPDRSSHLRRHWVDALALLPPVRSLRVLRLVRLVRTVASVHRAGMNVPGLARHRGFVTLVITWVGLGLVLSLAVYTAEQDGAGNLKTPLDAIWWGVGSLTTVGSELFPITVEGRFAAMILTLLGAFIFSAITATITSFLIGERSPRPDFVGQLERLRALRASGDVSADEYERFKVSLLAN